MKILIVDDERNNQLLLEEILEDIDGVEISFSDSGDDALELIRTRPYDVVFLDYHLPILNGKEVLDQLVKRQVTKLPAMVLVTGSVHIDSVEANHPLVKAWLRKPISKKRVLKVLETM